LPHFSEGYNENLHLISPMNLFCSDRRAAAVPVVGMGVTLEVLMPGASSVRYLVAAAAG